jgi:conjugative transposon TraN protein
MKHEFAILSGSLFIGLVASVMAQSAGPPNQAFINPSPVVHATASTTGPPPVPGKKSPSINEALLKDCCEKLASDKRRIYYLNTRNYRMSMQVKGIYTRDNMIFFRLVLSNHSHLDYDIDSIRFYIADNRWRKNTSLKVAGLSPVYVYGNTQVIRGKSQELPVVVLPRFTIGSGKHLVIELLEKNGGRNLQLQAYNFTLLRSRLI